MASTDITRKGYESVAAVIWRNGLRELCTRYVHRAIPLLFDEDDLEETAVDDEAVIDALLSKSVRNAPPFRMADTNNLLSLADNSRTAHASSGTRRFPFYVLIQYRCNGERDDATELDGWQGLTGNKYSERSEWYPELEALSKKWHLLATFQQRETAEMLMKTFRQLETTFSDFNGRGASNAYTRTMAVVVNEGASIAQVSKEAVQWLTSKLFLCSATHYETIAITNHLAHYIVTYVVPEFMKQYDAISYMIDTRRLEIIGDALEAKLVYGQFGEHAPKRFRRLDSMQSLYSIVRIYRSVHTHLVTLDNQEEEEDAPVQVEEEEDDDEDTTTSSEEEEEDDDDDA